MANYVCMSVTNTNQSLCIYYNTFRWTFIVERIDLEPLDSGGSQILMNLGKTREHWQHYVMTSRESMYVCMYSRHYKPCLKLYTFCWAQYLLPNIRAGNSIIPFSFNLTCVCNIFHSFAILYSHSPWVETYYRVLYSLLWKKRTQIMKQRRGRNQKKKK